MQIPQIEPMATLSTDYRSILAKLTNGPVVLAEQNRPAAVLVSVRDYEKMSTGLMQLELLREAKRNLAKADAHPETTIAHDDLKRILLQQGVKDMSDHVVD